MNKNFILLIILEYMLLCWTPWLISAPRDRSRSLSDASVEVLNSLELTQAWLEERPYYVVYIALAALDVILIAMSIIMLVGIDKVWTSL